MVVLGKEKTRVIFFSKLASDAKCVLQADAYARPSGDVAL